MLKVTLANSDVFKNSMGIISEIIDEGVFKFDSNGLSLLAPDRTMVAVVDFKLPSSAFEEYLVPSPRDVGLNMANLFSVLKRIKGNDKLTLSLADGSNKLEISVEKDNKRKFELPLIDIKMEKPPIDQLVFPARLDLDSASLEEGIEDASIVSDSIVLEANPDMFKLWAKGDISSSHLELAKGSNSLLALNVPQAIRARYPIDYLKKMVKACKLTGQVAVEFGTDYPLRLAFKQIDKLNLSFILAPRVEE